MGAAARKGRGTLFATQASIMKSSSSDSEVFDGQAQEPSSNRPRPVATMDRFIAASGGADGVQIEQLNPLTELSVRTRNSLYHITIVDPFRSRVLVSGGRFFPVRTNVILSGSSLGTSCLKTRWIGHGFCMEINTKDTVIITSPVRTIESNDVQTSTTPRHVH